MHANAISRKRRCSVELCFHYAERFFAHRRAVVMEEGKLTLPPAGSADTRTRFARGRGLLNAIFCVLLSDPNRVRQVFRSTLSPSRNTSSF